MGGVLLSWFGVLPVGLSLYDIPGHYLNELVFVLLRHLVFQPLNYLPNNLMVSNSMIGFV